MNRLSKQYYGLGTLITLSLFGSSQNADLDQAAHLIQTYENLLTVNRPQSEIMAINHAAGQHPVAVSDATYQIARQAIEVSRADFGFNALIGPLVKLWKIGFTDAQVPSPQQIHTRLALINPKDCSYNDQNREIYLHLPGMELDLGAIAKGYIADRVQDLWHAYGKISGSIDLGGNLMLMGPAPMHTDHCWNIGIQDPKAPRGQALASVHLPACSAVTSGIYERHLEVAGHSYHHILDPRTGYPCTNQLASVTFFSKKSIDGEIETARLFFAGGPLKNWGQSRSDLYGAVFVTKDHKLIVQKLKPEHIHLLNPHYHLQFSN